MTEMTSVGDDLLGFEKAIELDHLNNEQINQLIEMLKDFK
jgi:hypothetical protein